MIPPALQQLIMVLVVGLVAGWLAATLLKERRLGFLGYLVIGVVGSYLGFFLFRQFDLFALLGLVSGHIVGQLVFAFVGAIILILFLRVLRK